MYSLCCINTDTEDNAQPDDSDDDDNRDDNDDDVYKNGQWQR